LLFEVWIFRSGQPDCDDNRKIFVAMTSTYVKAKERSRLIGRDKYCFVKNYSKANNNYKQDEIIQMLDFLIDNIFVLFGGQVFQQTIDNSSLRSNVESIL
jgi:dihydrofolate reductase